MQSTNEKNRVLYSEVLRVLATLTVINLHATAPLLYEAESVYTNIWWIGNISDAASRWSVPAFIMISGMFLLNPSKNESITTFFKKRFLKVIIPLMFWSAMFTLWKMKHSIVHDSNFVIPFKNFFLDFITGQAYYHLWFVYMILGLYIITPVLRVFLKNADDKDILYFISMWFLINSVFGAIKRFFNINIGIVVEVLKGFVGYYILGYYLSKVEIKKKHRKLIYISSLFCLAVTIIGTYLLTIKNNGTVDEYLYGYLSINVVVMPAAMFLLFKNIDWSAIFDQHTKLSRVVFNLSSASFGIYLMHPIVMEILPRVGISYKLIHPLVGIPVTFISTISICFIITWIMQKNSCLKYLVP